MDGDKVVLGGTVTDQATKEKIIMAAGNVAGVAAVEDTLEGNDPVFHEVKKGDTLWAVAKKRSGRWQPLHGDFRGQQADALRSRQNLSGPDADHPAGLTAPITDGSPADRRERNEGVTSSWRPFVVSAAL